MENITDGEDVLNVGAVLSIALELSVSLDLKSSIVQVESGSDGIATDSEQHRIEGVALFALFVVPENGDGAVLRCTLEARWGRLVDELGVVVAHVLTDQICHILVESTQQD